MKRSKSLSLLLMGSLVAGSAGCSSETASTEEENFSAFTSMGECVSSGLFSEAECRELALGAIAQTPRFGSREECESQFGVGACQEPEQTQAEAGSQTVVQSHSGSMWMPMMMGFMAGRMLGGGGLMQGSQPLFRQPGAAPGPGGQTFRTATGDTVTADSKGRVANPSSRVKQSLTHNAKPAASRVAPAGRGGFSGGSRFGGTAGS